MSEPDEPFPLLRRILPYTSVAVIIAALYVGWIFYSRSKDDRDAARATQTKKAEDAQTAVDMYGGSEFEILGFTAAPGAIHRGESSNVCYGVNEAKSVKIDPPVDETLKPYVHHCFQISPRKTTQYTLTADDGKGHQKTASFTLQVIP